MRLHDFYKVKITRFLIDVALGLNATKIFQGLSTKSIFVYRDKTDIIKYHQIYDRNMLIDFLLNRTQLSNIINYDDWIYKENENYYIKFNLRVTFNTNNPNP